MRRTALVLSAVLALACGSPEQPAAPSSTAAARPAAPPLPTAAEAKALIAGSAALGEFEFTRAAVTLPMEKSRMNEPQLADANQLVKAGWLAFDGSGALVLAKARDDKRFLVRPNGFLDVVPIAKKEMGEVTSLRTTSPTEAEAGFSFAWVPTEVGAAFTGGPAAEMFAQPVKAKATLLWDGTSWSVLSVTRQDTAG